MHARPHKLLYRDDLVEDRALVTGEKRAAIDYHINLIGTGCECCSRIGELDLETRETTREGRRNGSDLDARAAQRLFGDGHEVGIDADRGDARHVGPARARITRLRAKRAHATVRIFALERREIDAANRERDAFELGRGLDRTLRERGRTRFEHDRIDADSGARRALA